MSGIGIFDIIGPIMIGPSSSHTAGAIRIGRLARYILGEEPRKAHIFLHGSFARTFRGHGTDKALVAGLLGLTVDDERVRDALDLAREKGLEVHWGFKDLGEVHPNSVELDLSGEQNHVKVLASSIGGGEILLSRLDGFRIEFSGKLPGLVAVYPDQRGVVAQVASVLACHEINIATMRVSRERAGGRALMAVETDQEISQPARQALLSLPMLEKIAILPRV
ncbi:L-serine ammonia-lyase, iron-sulfur-dependent subunit beta [Thermanaeromonas sp.]|uniref:L-serine ammonia-lyase, iron-sulfur-dependent subunit beta n=1 Tax=Thermanaeromonas sp. TaxID=2003697 RepID=UPI00261C5F03|nr:L-serine ammonia-lyase, iron-sulfur-dependent subunit beta [Thermanaeromonas sp.]